MFEIVDGVEATKMKPEKLRCTPHALQTMKLGEIGCYLGHLRIYQRIIDYGLPWEQYSKMIFASKQTQILD